MAAAENGSRPPATALYRTPQGVAYVGDALSGLAEHVEDGSAQLIMTSPPFALNRRKEYGNQPAEQYIEWFKPFGQLFWDKLADDGSLVIDIGGAWTAGEPTRSLYPFKLLIALCQELAGGRRFHLAQEFYWYNPAKLPLPAQWVTIERIRVKDAVNTVWWLSKSPRPKADNRRVLKPYSKSMQRLLERQSYNSELRPGGHKPSEGTWTKSHGGAIAPNVFTDELAVGPPEDYEEAMTEAAANGVNWLEIPNTESNSAYNRHLREIKAHEEELGQDEVRARARAHPARFPLNLPAFFVHYLTDPDDVVIDPFAGSNVTGEAAERAGRRWKAFELQHHYLEPSVARFDAYEEGNVEWCASEAPIIPLPLPADSESELTAAEPGEQAAEASG